MTWAEVFNTNHRLWSIGEAFRAAKNAGYKFIAWNGVIYFTDTEQTAGLTTEELENG
jgi:hypothetical protein